MTAAAVATLLAADAVEALPLRGTGELQFQSTESPGLPSPEEAWMKILRLDYARRLPSLLELSSHFAFSERTVVGRADRLRVPEWTLQLAHPYFGVLTSYRPSESRDQYGLTSRQQELGITAHVQAARMPQISGSWVRRHQDATPLSLASSAVTRTLSGLYTLGNSSLRAGYGDQYQEAVNAFGRRPGERHFSAGSSTQFRIGRAGTSLSYDFTQSRTDPGGLGSQLSRSHAAGVTSGLQIATRTSASLNYSFRHTETLGLIGSRTDEHVGALTIAHRFAPMVESSAGAGVRDAILNGQIQTESYVVAGATAEGDARPGWHLGAGLSHSLNWLPRQRVRASDAFQSSTRMRLRPGVDTYGTLLLSTSRTPDEVLFRGRQYSLQASAGVNAQPLRTLSMDGTWNRYRAGTSLIRGGSSTNAYVGNLRLRPSPRFQLNGSLGRTSSLGTVNLTRQASLQWSPSATMQVVGNYSRGRQERLDPAAPLALGQESWSGSVVMALGRDLTGTFRYTESNPGSVTHVRQVNASLVERFGR